jgi:hypothetical protein
MMGGATRNVIGDVAGSPNLLVNVTSGFTPSAAAARQQDVTPETAPRPAAPAAVPAAPRRSMSAPSTPRLVSAKRIGQALRLSIRGSGVGYQVTVNGKAVTRTTSLTPTVTVKGLRPGAKVRVRAYNSAGISAPSNTIRV